MVAQGKGLLKRVAEWLQGAKVVHPLLGCERLQPNLSRATIVSPTQDVLWKVRGLHSIVEPIPQTKDLLLGAKAEGKRV